MGCRAEDLTGPDGEPQDSTEFLRLGLERKYLDKAAKIRQVFYRRKTQAEDRKREEEAKWERMMRLQRDASDWKTSDNDYVRKRTGFAMCSSKGVAAISSAGSLAEERVCYPTQAMFRIT